jgi:hypothetical protein
MTYYRTPAAPALIKICQKEMISFEKSSNPYEILSKGDHKGARPFVATPLIFLPRAACLPKQARGKKKSR